MIGMLISTACFRANELFRFALTADFSLREPNGPKKPENW
jgi:hypothetical protein